MWCTQCDRELHKCACPDFEERMARLTECKYLHPSVVEGTMAKREEFQQQQQNQNEQNKNESKTQ